ncbi:MAG: hypothetical protein SYR96_39115 [Actinomycetota bacterium]|nr:hypothetical protein [Actinomycetota bacterium]
MGGDVRVSVSDMDEAPLSPGLLKDLVQTELRRAAVCHPHCRSVAWADTPIGHESTETGHGRTNRRTIRALPAPPGLPFPHVSQVWLIERYVTTSDGKQSAAAQPGVISHPADAVGPAEITPFNRGQ